MQERLSRRLATQSRRIVMAQEAGQSLAVGRLAVSIAVAVSALVVGTDVRAAFWPLVLVCIAVCAVELVVAARQPGALRQEVVIARDLVVVVLLCALSGGADSAVTELLFLAFVTMAAFALQPRVVLVVTGVLFGLLAGVDVLPGVGGVDARQAVEAGWIIALAVTMSVLVRRRDRALTELIAVRARLLADASDAEQRERDRLAEALHDDALQRVLAAGQDLEDGFDGGGEEAFAQARTTIRDAVVALRTLTKAMHGDRLADAGLETAIERVVEDAARRGRVQATIDVDAEASGEHDALVLAFVRELVTNVVKHARATHVSVVVSSVRDEVRLEVADDGVGMTADDLDRARESGHLGHVTLRDRVEALGGSVEIVSAPGEGTRVRLSLGEDRLRAQRALEQQLDRQREHVAALLAAVQEGFVVIRDGRIVEANERFAQLTGYDREVLPHLPAGAVPFWPAEGGDAFLAVLEAAERGREVQRELTLLAADGSRTPVLVSAKVARDRRGRLIGTMVTFKDVSEVVRQAEFARAMVRAFPGGLVVTDGDGIQHVNERFCELVGYTRDELVGMRGPFPFIAGLVGEDDADRDGDIVLLHRDGSRVEVVGASAMLRGSDGRWIGQVMAVRERAVATSAVLGERGGLRDVSA